MQAIAGSAEQHLKMRRRLHEAQESQGFRHFVEMASHDLKNPLYIIMSLASLLKASPDVLGEDRHFFDDLLDASRQLNGRMVSVLDLVAHLEGAGLVLERRWAQPHMVVADVVRLVRRTADTKQITLETPHVGEDTMLSVDVSVLERALENLVHNAIKYAPKGSSVSVFVQADGNGPVQFIVEDQGAGIPPADRDRLFDPFQRGHLSEHGSVGLGLALCKAAAERHGGRIWIENGAQGRGTRFVLSLPRSESR